MNGRNLFLSLALLHFLSIFDARVIGQNVLLSGSIVSEDGPLPFATVLINQGELSAISNEEGFFVFPSISRGRHVIEVSYVGYEKTSRSLYVGDHDVNLTIALRSSELNEVVVTGTLKEMDRLDSPVPVEVYNPSFFKRNPTPSIYEAMQNVNGVRPQLNCNVCNTGDIHINGLEGPYTMILIDGMPIVSGLASVYGLSGIPTSMIERVEVVKGPASSLYGSEALGGLINVITKKTSSSPVISLDLMTTTWQEYNADAAFKFNLGKKVSVLSGLNYFNYSNPIDNNGDNFTDITLQNRISAFQKWNIDRKKNRLFSVAARYLYEDRWGGEMDWTPEFRGGDSLYAESIYTNRWELVSTYQLPIQEKVLFMVSLNQHDQNSVYGNVPYYARQNIGFVQSTWDKKLGRHDMLTGAAVRYTFYDDNTTATEGIAGNEPSVTWLPGMFFQDEIGLNEHNKLLLGLRYDFNSNHGNIWTPRFAYKWSPNSKNVVRLNGGTGYRVVNLFTEEHAALTGAREVIIADALDPEKSYNLNVNVVRKVYFKSGAMLGLDASTWYTYFTDQIIPDYDSDPNQTIYDNLNGSSTTRGVSLNAELDFMNGFRGTVGVTYMDVFFKKQNSSGGLVTKRPVLTESWAGVWSMAYTIRPIRLTVDYTGNLYGPMRLPTLGPLDPRDSRSNWWSIQNIQLTYESRGEQWEVYGGVKNLLNFTPPSNSIARSHDPFDKSVTFDSSGQPISTAENPYALTFDPSYVYAPNQGIRGFLGIRWKLW